MSDSSVFLSFGNTVLEDAANSLAQSALWVLDITFKCAVRLSLWLVYSNIE